MDINALLDSLKAAREQSAAASEAKRRMVEEVKALPKYQEADAAQQTADDLVSKLEATIRRMALDLHALAAELPERVKVKMFTVVNEYDANAAREWCMSNFRPALKLDTKTFDDAVKKGQVPAEIATAGKEARAQIDTKL